MQELLLVLGCADGILEDLFDAAARVEQTMETRLIGATCGVDVRLAVFNFAMRALDHVWSEGRTLRGELCELGGAALAQSCGARAGQAPSLPEVCPRYPRSAGIVCLPAVSLLEPFASAVLTGLKTSESRGWPMLTGLRGHLLLIRAGEGKWQGVRPMVEPQDSLLAGSRGKVCGVVRVGRTERKGVAALRLGGKDGVASRVRLPFDAAGEFVTDLASPAIFDSPLRVSADWGAISFVTLRVEVLLGAGASEHDLDMYRVEGMGVREADGNATAYAAPAADLTAGLSATLVTLAAADAARDRPGAVRPYAGDGRAA